MVEQSKERRMYGAALIFLYTGLRRGELILLLCTDIDLGNQEICIDHSVYQTGNKFIIQDCLKTNAGRRSVKIPEILCNTLKEEKQVCKSK